MQPTTKQDIRRILKDIPLREKIRRPKATPIPDHEWEQYIALSQNKISVTQFRPAPHERVVN